MPLRVLLFIVLGVGCPPVAAAQVSETELIELASKLPEIAASEHRAATLSAKVLGAGLYPNPSLGWEREAMVPGQSGSEREDVYSLSMPLDFSSKRRTRELLAHAELEVANAVVMTTRTQAVTSVLSLFYDLVAAQKRREIERRALDRLTEAARVIGKRVDQGSASGYDLTRIEIEAQIAESELRQTEARLKRDGRALAVLLAMAEPEPAFGGSLSLRPKSAPGSVPPNRSLTLWRTASAKAERASQASNLSWIPTLSLDGGLRIDTGADSHLGYVAGISVDVPLFSHGQDLRAEAHAQSAYARARLDAAERAVAVATARAQADLAAASAEAKRFEDATGGRIAALERAVESGYREGQRSIVELLDARRARTMVELRSLSLALAAKKAELALRAARGEFE